MDEFLTKQEALDLCEKRGYIVMDICKDHIKILDRCMNNSKILIEKEETDERDDDTFLHNQKLLISKL